MTTKSAPIRLFISVISARQWPVRFGESLTIFALHLGAKGLDGRMAQINVSISRQAHPSTTRNEHLTRAIAEGFTHFLSLDDDQTFPPDIVERMLAHKKPVVTCNYRKKQDEIAYVCSSLEGGMLDSTHRTGIERCKAMGMGMALIDLDAIRHIKPPYFAVVWNADTGGYMIEDAIFSYVLWQNDIEMWCDHDLSREIGHVGEFEYRLPPYTPSLTLVEQDAA